MSKLKMRHQPSYQYKHDPEFCKRVVRTAAALLENSSDPFYYTRTLNLIIRGMEDVHELNKIVQGKMQVMSKVQISQMTERAGFILRQN